MIKLIYFVYLYKNAIKYYIVYNYGHIEKIIKYHENLVNLLGDYVDVYTSVRKDNSWDAYSVDRKMLEI